MSLAIACVRKGCGKRGITRVRCKCPCLGWCVGVEEVSWGRCSFCVCVSVCERESRSVRCCALVCRKEVSECEGKEKAPLCPGGWSESPLLTSNTLEGGPYVLSPHTTEGFCGKGLAPQELFPAQGRGKGLRTSTWTVRGRGMANRAGTDGGKGEASPYPRAELKRTERWERPFP